MVYKNDDFIDKKDWILVNKNNGNGVKCVFLIFDWKLRNVIDFNLLLMKIKLKLLF